MSHKITPVRVAVLPVAGHGTRLLPATLRMPKEMLTIVDRPLIQRAVEEALQAGIERFVFVISREKEVLIHHFEEPLALMEMLKARGKTTEIKKVQETTLPKGSIREAHQEQALGLGHAVWCAREEVGNEPFAVILPDDTVRNEQGCLAQMVSAYNSLGGNVVATCEIDPRDSSKYGVLDVTSREGRIVSIKGLVEKPQPADAPSNMAIFGRYILQPEIFNLLERHEKGSGGEIQLTDAMGHLLKEQPFHGYEFQGERLDCGNDEGFVKANIAFALDNEKLSPEILRYMAKKLEEYNYSPK